MGQGLLGVALVYGTDQRGAADDSTDQGRVDQGTEAGGERRPGDQDRGERVDQFVGEGAEQPAAAARLAGAAGLAAFGLGVGQPVGAAAELLQDGRHRHQVPGGDGRGGCLGVFGQAGGPPHAVTEGQCRRAVDRGEGTNGQHGTVGGECAQCAETRTGQPDAHVLHGHPASHPGGLDDQCGDPQVGADEQVRTPRWQRLRVGDAQAAVRGGERRPVAGDEHHHGAFALQYADRGGQLVVAGQQGVGEGVSFGVTAGHDDPQSGLPGDSRQAVDARCGFRIDPEHGGQGVALGEAEQVSATFAQPAAVVGVAGVAYVELVEGAELPAVESA